MEILLNKNYLNLRIVLKAILHSLYKVTELYTTLAGHVESSL